MVGVKQARRQHHSSRLFVVDRGGNCLGQAESGGWLAILAIKEIQPDRRGVQQVQCAAVFLAPLHHGLLRAGKAAGGIPLRERLRGRWYACEQGYQHGFRFARQQFAASEDCIIQVR